MLKKITLTLSGTLLVFASVAFAIKAGLGVLPVDAAITSAAQRIGIKVGTVGMIFQFVLFLAQFAIQPKSFRPAELFQVAYLALGGTVLNFFLYTVLAGVTFSAYPVRAVVCVLAFVVSSFGVTLVLHANLMRTPFEGFTLVLAERLGLTLGRVRQLFDVTMVAISVAITLLFGTDWALREGTLVAAAIFGPLQDFWRRTVFADKAD